MAGQGRQVGGGPGPQHGGAVLGGERAQADPVAQVAVEPTHPARLEALAGQDEVHPQAASGAPDREQDVEDVGARLEQFAELVHDDHEERHRRQLGALPPQRPVLRDPLHVRPRGAEQLLAPLELAHQRRLHPVDQ